MGVMDGEPYSQRIEPVAWREVGCGTAALKRELCKGKNNVYTPTDHVGKRVILLDNFYGGSVRNFRVLGHFDPK